ncbi:hypothetical protein P1P75_27115 [Streptomyces sp. ID05-39B]|uniref:hypothetical protein n=1 Tax=Streptomyces sp. ID05-39B TaxID=3028664 RepID=UPI0029BC96C3|nr:hypothetical protein [Streptomyces sp. ID05-39B]MDX3529987.1 hypothetical protein [Streptomyces sp. ID05-39B]
MEQRIGSSSQPLEGAGFDPAFIPGLTSPVTAAAKDAKPKDAKPETAKPEDDSQDGAAVTAGDASESEPAAAAGESEDAESKDSESKDSESEDPESDEASDGPVFEAADRRARIVADSRGVRLRLDEEECEFRWEEIGAIETEVPRFGKRLTITVHTPDRRWYPIEIEATARDRFKEWDEQLDAVLDAYFDDEAEGKDADSQAAEESAS